MNKYLKILINHTKNVSNISEHKARFMKNLEFLKNT